MRGKFIIGNWKMNYSLDESIVFIQELLKIEYLKDVQRTIQIGIAPSYPFLDILKKMCKNAVLIIAQNIHHHDSGSYTGEVSAKMIKSIDIDMVILGHSERKEKFYETDDILLKKILQALKYDIKCIFCVGETLLQRNNNNHFNIIKDQLQNTIFHLSSKEVQSVIIAYEPIWAIGSGTLPQESQIQKMHYYIRNLFLKQYGSLIASNINIIYGGSLNSSNAKKILSQQDIDGGLIGNASLIIHEFINIINHCIKLSK